MKLALLLLALPAMLAAQSPDTIRPPAAQGCATNPKNGFIARITEITNAFCVKR